ncbi:MAG TPA: hypothetical protein EYN74_09450 [Nitrospirales bacterium]|nr:hypothetical protein [Nitrospirales bacterium]HIN33920.1 hypothetical protein [Nitrospirales bacterium]
MTRRLKTYGLISLIALVGLFIPIEPVTAESSLFSGFYFGVGASHLIEVFDVSKRADEPLTDVQFDDGLRANVKAGYRIHPRFSLELDALIAREFSTPGQSFLTDESPPSVPASGGGQDLTQESLQFEGVAYTVNGKGYLLTGRVQPYLNMGIGVLDGKLDGSSRSDVILRPGGGIDAYVTNHILAYVEASYLWGFGEVRQFDTIPITIGIQYKF